MKRIFLISGAAIAVILLVIGGWGANHYLQDHGNQRCAQILPANATNYTYEFSVFRLGWICHFNTVNKGVTKEVGQQFLYLTIGR